MPLIGVKHVGTSIEIQSKHYSICGTSDEVMVSSFSSLADVASSLHQSKPLPEAFLRAAYDQWEAWHMQAFRRYLIRPGRYEAQVNVTPQAIRRFHGLSHGDIISTPHGDATVLGVSDDNLWFQVHGHERWGAWFCTLTELKAPGSEYKLLTPSTKPHYSSDLLASYVTFEEFRAHATSLGATTGGFGDTQIIQLVDALSFTLKTHNITPQHLIKAVQGFARRHPAAVIPPPLVVSCRFMLLSALNQLISDALPLVDLHRTANLSQPSEDAPIDQLSFGSLLAGIRGLIFLETKNKFLQDLLIQTRCDPGAPEEQYLTPSSIEEYTVNRQIELNKIAEMPARVRKSLLGQLFMALKSPNSSEDQPFLRQMYVPIGREDRQPRSFKFKLNGECADDEGGPYREVFMMMFDQLHSLDTDAPLLPFFQPCPNFHSRSPNAVNKNLWVINPSRNSPEDLGHFYFIGVMIGMAIRHNVPLPSIEWPDLYWKRLVGQPVCVEDLRQYDSVFYEWHFSGWQKFLRDQAMQDMPAADADRILADCDVAWAVYSQSLGKWVPLREGSPEVKYHELVEYSQKAVDHLLTETQAQLKSIRSGIASIVPLPVFSLFSARDLATLVQGPVEIDVSRLRMHTKYEGVDPDAEHIAWFWEALEEMDNADRSEFLQFVWSRSRLPISDAQWDRPMTIRPGKSEGQNPDAALPTVRTCFFLLNLPAFTSKKTMVEKLHFVKSVREQDADYNNADTSDWQL